MIGSQSGKKKSVFVFMCVISSLYVIFFIVMDDKNFLKEQGQYLITGIKSWGLGQETVTISMANGNISEFSNQSTISPKDDKMKLVETQQCVMPKLNPWDPEIKSYIRKPWIQKCKNKRYGVVKNGVLRLKERGVVSVSLQYVRRVDDWKFTLSDKVQLFGDGVSIYAKEGKSCWKECGSKGGHCPKVCGENGYCCRQGYKDCDSKLISDKRRDVKSHSCIQPDKANIKPVKGCWTECGNKGGHCPKFCGENGYCCRQGHKDCDEKLIKDSRRNKELHACIQPEKVPTFPKSTECEFKMGGSLSEGKIWLGNKLKQGDCVKSCLQKRKSNPNVSGVTTRTDGSGCWCQIGTNQLDLSKTQFKTCVFGGGFTNKGLGRDCDIEYAVQEEYFKLEIFFANSYNNEYHYAFLNTTAKKWGIKKTPFKDQLNVIFVMFDALSRPHAERSMVKTYKYLKEHPRAFIMQGHSVVGDGTTVNLNAMLTGKPLDEQPEGRVGYKNAKHLDAHAWEFLFPDLHKRNYMTCFSEDTGSGTGAWTYRLKGFLKEPTTHYTMNLWLSMKKRLFNQISCPHEYNYEYLRDYFNELRDYNKFAIATNALIHDSLNYLENADDDTLNFYKMIENTEHANNTVIILVGDHGIRAVSGFRATYAGKLEERSPMCAILLPPRFDAHKDVMENLRINSQIMTTPYDLYNTLQHISTFPKLNENVNVRKYGRSLFTDIASLNRTCAEAGMDSHWCKCLNYEKVDPQKDKYVQSIIDKVLRFINEQNNKTAPNKCHVLKLLNITRAGRRSINKEITQFKSVDWWSKPGTDQILIDKRRKMPRYVYEVVFKVSPSMGEYEAEGQVDIKSNGRVTIEMNKEISRISHYGNQPDCVADKFPFLRKYCFCKDFKGDTKGT